MVMGDSCFKSCVFESWHPILHGHFYIPICCKICNVCLKRQTLMKKRPGLALKNCCVPRVSLAIMRFKMEMSFSF